MIDADTACFVQFTALFIRTGSIRFIERFQKLSNGTIVFSPLCKREGESFCGFWGRERG